MLAAMVSASVEALVVVQQFEPTNFSDYLVVFVNEAAAKFLGRKPEEIIGQRVNEVTPPFKGSFHSQIRRAIESRAAVTLESTQLSPTLDASKATLRIVAHDGFVVIATRNQTVEHSVEAQAEMTRRLLVAQIDSSLTPAAVVRLVRDEHSVGIDVLFDYANDQVGALLGLPEGTLLPGTKLYDHLQRRTFNVVRLVEDVLATRRMQRLDFDTRDTDIKADWLRLQLTPVDDYVVLHAEDISVSQREEATLRAIVEQGGELITVTDVDGRIRYTNPFSVHQLGYRLEDLLGRSLTDLCVAHDRKAMYTAFLAMKSGERSHDRHRTRFVDNHGNERTLVGSTVALRTPLGQFDGCVTISADVTERLASEAARHELAAALAVAEQHERDRIAGEIHDGPVQLLTALSMRLGASQDKPLDNIRALLGESETAVIACIQDLRNLMFQLSPPDLDGIGLVQAIRSRSERIFADTATSVSVISSVSIDPAGPVPITLFQLAQEAMVNARKHARATQLQVTLSQDRRTDPDGTLRRSVVLEIVDDGVGAQQERYLQDEPGHLGISMMYDRTRQLGGSCAISGSPGNGTHIRIKLPLPEESAN